MTSKSTWMERMISSYSLAGDVTRRCGLFTQQEQPTSSPYPKIYGIPKQLRTPENHTLSTFGSTFFSTRNFPKDPLCVFLPYAFGISWSLLRTTNPPTRRGVNVYGCSRFACVNLDRNNDACEQTCHNDGSVVILNGNALFQNGTWRISGQISSSHWSLWEPESKTPFLPALGSLAVGSIGNLPAIELIQRNL